MAKLKRETRNKTTTESDSDLPDLEEEEQYDHRELVLRRRLALEVLAVDQENQEDQQMADFLEHEELWQWRDAVAAGEEW